MLLSTTFLRDVVKREGLPITEIMPNEPRIIKVDGIKHEVRLEVFNGSTASIWAGKSTTTDGDQFGIYADPANYYDGESDHVDFPVQIVSLKDGEYVTREEIWTAPYAADIDLIDDEFSAYISNLRDATPFPLFAVTAEFADADLVDEQEGLSKTGSVAYLGIEGIYLKVERDGLTNEEFELWWTDPYLNLVHQRDMFNGNKHYDASGTNVKFPDVNTKGHWYQIYDEYQDSIRLIALSNYAYQLTPWEDDDASGSMHRDPRPWMVEEFPVIVDGVITGGKFHTKIWKDVFNTATNIVEDDINIPYVVDSYSAYGDEDDLYSEGAVYAITHDAVLTRSLQAAATGGRYETNNALNKKLDDINYRFKYRN